MANYVVSMVTLGDSLNHLTILNRLFLKSKSSQYQFWEKSSVYEDAQGTS